MNKVNITNFRLACALIANKENFLGIVSGRYLSPKYYVFEKTETINNSIESIETNKDKVASVDLFLASDFLCKRLAGESYRAQLTQEMFNV